MEPRVLTADELRMLPRLAIVFIECWDGEYQDALPEILAAHDADLKHHELSFAV